MKIQSFKIIKNFKVFVLFKFGNTYDPTIN